MRERFNFVGPNITPGEERRATDALRRFQSEGNELLPQEQQKTRQELVAINLFDSLLKREFLELGITEVPELRPEQFRIMSDGWFNENRDKGTMASYYSLGDIAAFNRSRSGSPLGLYKTFLHEGIHAASHQKHWLDVETDEKETYRVGYYNNNVSDEKEARAHFRGLNEGVVEGTVEEMFWKYQNDIRQALKPSADELRRVMFSYELPRAVVNQICEALALYQGVEKKVAWDRMKKGQFTGEMMHLREVELAYDMGALRVLDALDVSTDILSQSRKLEQLAEARNKKILEYFRSYGENKSEKRRQLAQEILGEADYKKYCA